jgi:hypothetical protein
LAAAGFAGACPVAFAGVLAGGAGGVCVHNEFGKASNTNTPNDNAFLGKNFITVSSQYVATWESCTCRKKSSECHSE